ncbi:phage tail assembly protein [Amycolatopsis sp. SID8362]|uniref:phage tail assembly protein n=1 Tax=Amycolatopsis sp. SID8362 TaxID=2690346 RepID=UPI0013718D21|nr:phage tail assembly protein [Amycolatopsis sp. SID8362]NBH06054.1 phage tail assembly protein [Amycolatopsis sp. SID8362]NED42753.1 phage tail assembly protein [Amycolatopsis sp. SID8362]
MTTAAALPGTGGSDAVIRTEYPFVLPRGYVDEQGALHRTGAMRLATAKDELSAQQQPKVQQNSAYLSVYLLASTVTSLGSVSPVDPFVIENLFASDMAFLQDLYRRINQAGNTEVDVRCPSCSHEFVIDVAGDAPGES